MPILPPAIKNLVDSYPTRIFTQGRSIVYQGEIPRCGYLILRGTARILALDVRGDESNISFIAEGNVFPVEVIFEKTTSSLHYYEASTEVEAAVIPMQDLRDWIEKDSEIKSYFLDSIVTQYVGSKIHIQALEQSRAQEKIVRILQYLVLRFGEEHSNNMWRINLKLKQHDIANMVGVTRETAATELSKLKKMNVINYDSFHYVVDMRALSNMVGTQEWESVAIS